MTGNTLAITSRFGEIAFDESDIIRFDDGLVGLPSLKRFILLAHRPDSPFHWLQSLDDTGFALLVVDPGHYVADYAPTMPQADVDALQIDQESPIVVYTVCSIPPGDPKGMTLNLAGPIVICLANGRGRQIVLEDDGLPVRYPVFQAAKAA